PGQKQARQGIALLFALMPAPEIPGGVKPGACRQPPAEHGAGHVGEQKQHNAKHKIQGGRAQCGIARPEISKHINSSCWAAWRPGCKCMANARPPCSGQGTYIVRPLSVYHTYRAA